MTVHVQLLLKRFLTVSTAGAIYCLLVDDLKWAGVCVEGLATDPDLFLGLGSAVGSAVAQCFWGAGWDENGGKGGEILESQRFWGPSAACFRDLFLSVVSPD